MRVGFPVIMIDSFHPLQETICKRVQVWARRGSKVELPVLYPYDFNIGSLIGKTFKVKRYRVKVEGIKYGGETLFQLKILTSHCRTISEPIYIPHIHKIEHRSLSTQI